MGLPAPSDSAFALDPEIKRECIWAGPVFKPDRILVYGNGPAVQVRTDKGWQILADGLSLFESLFVQIADPNNALEVLLLRPDNSSARCRVRPFHFSRILPRSGEELSKLWLRSCWR